MAISCDGLTKDYGRRRALDGLTLDVRRAEVFGYLGSNGAGKTTTIRCLLDLIRPTQGRATVLGFDTKHDSVEVRRRTGYLPGDLRLYPRLTARQLFEYLGHLRGGVPAARIQELARRLDCNLDQRCGSMSHGQRQKVGVIQAMMHDPELLILDEPTATLDPLVQHSVHDLVGEAKARGCTVFLSSHNLTEVARVCDRAGILRLGKLVAIEDVAALEAEGRHVVTIEFAEEVDPLEFKQLPGVASVTTDNHTLTLDVSGELDRVVKTAARHTVRTI
ncbi:MAG: ABC transporter ATP-binding protein, partial [Candidatus Dormibacteraeota bacterium]|nr:ABC transporter ATP-binding protein [Candidatus Dormibacteraeota bacterium]